MMKPHEKSFERMRQVMLKSAISKITFGSSMSSTEFSAINAALSRVDYNKAQRLYSITMSRDLYAIASTINGNSTLWGALIHVS